MTQNVNDAFFLADKRDTLVKAYLMRLEDNVWTEHCGKFGEQDGRVDNARNQQRHAYLDTLKEMEMRWKEMARCKDHLYSSRVEANDGCVGVGISQFQRKLEGIFLDRTRVGKVKNFTDFTDRTTLPKPTDTGKSVTVSVGLGRI